MRLQFATKTSLGHNLDRASISILLSYAGCHTILNAVLRVVGFWTQVWSFSTLFSLLEWELYFYEQGLWVHRHGRQSDLLSLGCCGQELVVIYEMLCLKMHWYFLEPDLLSTLSFVDILQVFWVWRLLVAPIPVFFWWLHLLFLFSSVRIPLWFFVRTSI